MNSESRVPWMRRERMSRPTSSVPSRKTWPPIGVSEGGASVASRNCSDGLYGAMTLASTAKRTSITTTERPATAPRLRRKSRHSSAAGVGGAITIAAMFEVVVMRGGFLD